MQFVDFNKAIYQKKISDLYKKKNYSECLNCVNEYLRVYTKDYQYFCLAGTLNKYLKKYDSSEFCFKKAIQIDKKNYLAHYNLGNLYFETNDFLKAIEQYVAALKINKENSNVYLNIGVCYAKVSEYALAENFLLKAHDLKDNDINIVTNLITVYKILKDKPQVERFVQKALKLDKNNIILNAILGDINLKNKDYFNATINFSKVIAQNFYFKFAFSNFIYSKLFNCDWEHLDKKVNILKKELNSKILCHPLVAITLFDDPKLQQACSKKYCEDIFVDIQKEKASYKKNNKIRIGYFSSDFHNHPSSQLSISIFEKHDKNKFEIHGFSFFEKNDELNQRIKKSFDFYHDVSKFSDSKIIELARKKKIDIAIDLMVHTRNSRSNIFLNNISPIQVNFLGYPGTSGSKKYDYIIADEVIINKKNLKYFDEKPIFLKGSYQPNDEKTLKVKKNNKSDFGFTEDSIIFGCFSNQYKILPNIFNYWIQILKNVKKSYLWLLIENDTARQNLSNYAKNKLDPNKLVFANKINRNDHFSRLSVVDIGLDTYPYNGHTTTSDLLSCNVPIITLQGNSFASRVTSSLLNDVSLNELIANNFEDYVSKAISIGSDKNKIKNLKEKLKKNYKFSNKLSFEKYINNYEQKLKEIVISKNN